MPTAKVKRHDKKNDERNIKTKGTKKSDPSNEIKYNTVTAQRKKPLPSPHCDVRAKSDKFGPPIFHGPLGPLRRPIDNSSLQEMDGRSSQMLYKLKSTNEFCHQRVEIRSLFKFLVQSKISQVVLLCSKLQNVKKVILLYLN